MFPSFIRHMVTPVTEGVRKNLVLFLNGPNLK
jgi:predicted 2-oxoglutarate/Fe(II)-dependent dioxygenase YbiX